MEIIEIPSDFDLTYTSATRSDGLHVSQVIREIATVMGILTREDQEEIDWTLAKYRIARGARAEQFPVVFYRVALGLAWEEWLARRKPELAFHMCELSELVDGEPIYGTPDGFSINSIFWELEPETWIIHEIKLTWKSSRDDRESPQERIAKEWLWLAQIKCYCHLAGPRFRTAVLHVYWVCGNYKGSGPQYRSYVLKFTDEEIAGTWKQISRCAARVRANEPLIAIEAEYIRLT